MKAVQIEGTMCVKKMQVCASMGDKDRREEAFKLIVLAPEGRLSPHEIEYAVKGAFTDVIYVGAVILSVLGEGYVPERAFRESNHWARWKVMEAARAVFASRTACDIPAPVAKAIEALGAAMDQEVR